MKTFKFAGHLAQREAQRLFVACDEDGDRRLTLEELRSVLEQ